MSPFPPTRKPAKARRARADFDFGRWVARSLCLLFALVGAIPLTGGLVLRSRPVQKWAVAETSRVLREQLGVSARFEVELKLIPLRLAVKDLEVPSKDGGPPALQTRLAAVSPRFFSLLAGRIDVGDIELEESQVRLVLEHGVIQNVAYRFPTRTGKRPPLVRSPFRSLAVTGARLDLEIDGTHVVTDDIDIDAFAEPNLAFDVAIRMAGATATRRRVTGDTVSIDEDRLCAFDLRTFVSERQLSLKRLSLGAVLDSSPEPGTRPDCSQNGDSRVLLRLSHFNVALGKSQGTLRPTLDGKLTARLPAAIANRFAPRLAPLRGWAGFSGTVRYDGSSHLPDLEGQLSGERLGLGRYAFAEKLQAEVRILADTVRVPLLEADYANGTIWIESLSIEPFAKAMPMAIASVRSKGITFPGMMRDVGVAPNTIVDWNLGDMVVSHLGGTLAPFYIDGGFVANTHDFAVYNRAWHDPSRKRMIGVQQAKVEGRFRAHQKALEFYDTVGTFGKSSLPVDLVSIGWKNDIILRLGQGVTLDLADVSPIAGIDVAGTASLDLEMAGQARHVALDGDVAVAGLSIGGFEAGDLSESRVHFEPLRVDFLGAEGRKGDMTYSLPSAQLNFDGPASVEFTAFVDSKQFVIQRFFEIFHFDLDPRFQDISGSGKTLARVRYVLGGKEDACKSGRLTVDGRTQLATASVWGESFTAAESDFHFEWFDITAGSRGMRLDVPSVALRKGSGTVFGSAKLTPGGALRADFVGSRLPVSRIDSLAGLAKGVEGYVTGTVHVGGNIEALSFQARADMTELRTDTARLPPSSLTAVLEPKSTVLESSGKTSGCGRLIGPEFDPARYAKDESDGTFRLDGQLFGQQIRLTDLRVSRQRSKHIQGKVDFQGLDLASVMATLGYPTESSGVKSGLLSGHLELVELPLDHPFAADVRFDVHDFQLDGGAFSVGLWRGGAAGAGAAPEATPGSKPAANAPALVVIKDRALSTSGLALAVKTPTGQSAVLDAKLHMGEDLDIDAEFTLRETSLSMLVAAAPGIERAEGRLLGRIGAHGRWPSPQLSGAIEVHGGKIVLKALPTPISDLELQVDLASSGLSISRGEASWGGGKLELKGSVPLFVGKLGEAQLALRARHVSLPLSKEARVTFDSDLRLTVPAESSDGRRALPVLSGRVDLDGASYKSPMTVTADIATLTTRGKKSDVQNYDAAADRLEIDVVLRSRKPAQVANNLVDTNLLLDPQGLRISGTDQRFGAVGGVELPAGGRIHLRGHEFEIQGGLVRFDDPTRLRPQVDLSAVSDFRRYNSTTTSGVTNTNTTTSTSGAPVAGNWRIYLHAYGEPEDLKVDLSSDPPLAQDDIFLLLTVGMTQTEMNQSRSTGLGSSVALEALGSLSGAESAVTETVQVDEFRFGSTYSSRSGRTEPTVTVGKRLSERIRATITTSLSDASEVRSNVEYRATGNLSVEGSYDNAQSSGSTNVGNVGGDIRWRLEFE